MARRQNEFLSPEGLRIDGRRAGESRRLRCRIGTLPKSDGSAYVEQGNTKVLACVTGPRDARGLAHASHERALITCEFEALPFATGQHKPSTRADRGAAELAAAVRRAFEPVVRTQLYPRTHIDIRLTLMQSDGGVHSACLNATTLALIDAGIAIEDFVCGCSAGAVGGTLLLDPNAVEAAGVAEMSVGYLPCSQRVSHVQLESRIPVGSADEVLHFAIEGCRQLYEVMRSTVQARLQEQLHSRGVLNT